jgi:peptidoglycan/xylan/chitin deacetylase (PgdA/CDA1 family)
MIISGATEHRMILFTFDDGPDVRTTPLLLDRLDAAGVKAVFFLTANRLGTDTPILRQQTALAREIVQRGHMVGNHTVDHVQMPLLDDDAAKQELLRSEAIFERVFGARPWIFRPPFGAHSERIDFHLAARDYTTVLWNLGAGDFQVRTAQEVFELWRRIFERRERERGERGGIVLLHDTYTWSVDAFQLIYSYLLDRNCELLARGEELFDVVDDPRFFFVPRGDAPPSALAPGAAQPPEVFEARQARLRDRTRQRCRSLATL